MLGYVTVVVLVLSIVAGVVHYRLAMVPYTGKLPQPKEFYSAFVAVAIFFVYLGILLMLRIDGII